MTDDSEPVRASARRTKKPKSGLMEENSWGLSPTGIQRLVCIEFTLNFFIDDKQSTSTLSFNENDHRRKKKRTSDASSMLTDSRHDSSHASTGSKVKSRSMESANPSSYNRQRRGGGHHGSPYIWSGSIRRERGISTPAHENVMRQAVPYMQATIMTGYASEGCGPWADSQQKANLSTLIKSIWLRVANRMGRVSNRRDDDVEVEPAPHEARKVK